MRVAVIAAVLLATFTACTSGDSGKSKEWKGELPIAEAFLRRQLPSGVVAYARVPNLLGLLTMPKQGQLEAALRSEANIRNVAGIQQGLAKSVLQLPAFSDPRVGFMADVVRSPIEFAVLGTPGPSMLCGATLAIRSVDEFNQLFAALGRMGPSISLAAPLDAQGIGELAGLPFAAFARFDPDNGRLLVHLGPAVTRAAFEELLQSLPANLDDHPMYALEQKIDGSGHGMFVWADAERIVPTFMPNAPPSLERAGLGGLRAGAFGFGTANGKGRLSFVADVGRNRQASTFPVVNNDVRATAVGDPDAAVLVSLPGKSEFSRLQSKVMDALPPGAVAGWEQGKSGLSSLIGVELEEVFAAIGPEVIFIFDQAGDYAAVRLRNADLFDDVVRRIAVTTGSGPVQQKVDGKTFWHWRLPSFFSLAASANPDVPDTAGEILAVLGRAQSHVYWMHEGEYLYVAQAPQPLIDRVNAGARTSVAEWLETRQRIDISTSVFAATGSVSKMPRRTYEMYIGILQFLADITEAQFDVWSMPTADQLALPDSGAIGCSVNLGEPHLSVELTYENHPGELLLGGGGFGAVAMVGIVAAIAIPAYQDYTIRAQVTEGLNLASAVKAAVAESHAARGVLPRDRRAAGLPPAPGSSSGRYVEGIDIANGVITVTFGHEANAVINGARVVMIPVANADGDIGWLCGYAASPAGTRLLAPPAAGQKSTIAPKHLPSTCR